MKYFLDTEFIEGFHKHPFHKRRHHIDLISIGIVSEDDREYYAISNEFNPKHANDWVQLNVIAQLPLKLMPHESVGQFKKRCKLNEYYAGKWYDGKKNDVIANEIREFCTADNIEFWGYFSDYDWVVFCSLFGTMMDLPKGFPMYCLDLKQRMFEYNLSKDWKAINCPDPEGQHDALVDARWNKKLYSAILRAI